ncbi:hypothetical protein LCGC14_0456610 [marine sediment metagenome]|uniref:Ubiquitin-activating enzyme E1 FCCH domain-containing protein n=1 Tax=marine sediment metagenome TaxID=412755 RepID=A0A0F9SLF7_9ZZZZ
MALATNENMIRGQFTSDGASETINLPWEPSRITLLNFTQFASAAGTTPVITAEWREGMDNGTVITGLKTNGAATIQIPAMNATDGITIRDTSVQTPEAAGNAITAITQAAGAVVSKIAHGYIVGDRVRIFGTTAMFEIAGMDFTVTAVGGANVFTIGYLDSSGFGAAATAGTARRIPNNPIYFPERLFVTGITAAASAVVTMSVTHGLSVGQVVRMKVPAAFGMVEMDGLRGEITAINAGTNTITLDIDSSAFTAFAFPTSAVAAAGVDFSLVVPFGDAGNVLAGAQDNVATFQAFLGTSAIGGANDVMEWIAERALAI